MTLDFTKTAPDHVLMNRIGPRLLQICMNTEARRFTMKEFRAELQHAVNDLPDSPYWARTRHRASTPHGSYAIQQAFEMWAIAQTRPAS